MVSPLSWQLILRAFCAPLLGPFYLSFSFSLHFLVIAPTLRWEVLSFLPRSATTTTTTMATEYAMPVVALAALATGANDNPAPAIALGDATGVQHVVAARAQHANRKRLATLDPPQATGTEVVDSKRRKHLVQSANFDGDVPMWAQQMQNTIQHQLQQHTNTIQQRMDAIQERMDTIQEQLQGMQVTQQQAMEQMDRRIQLESDRSMNRSLRTSQNPIVAVIRLSDGLRPTDNDANNLWFPEDYKRLHNATGAHINPLLAFYKLDQGGNLGDKKDRLQAHLGVTL
jgi:hypothetical protein